MKTENSMRHEWEIRTSTLYHNCILRRWLSLPVAYRYGLWNWISWTIESLWIHFLTLRCFLPTKFIDWIDVMLQNLMYFSASSIPHQNLNLSFWCGVLMFFFLHAFIRASGVTYAFCMSNVPYNAFPIVNCRRRREPEKPEFFHVLCFSKHRCDMKIKGIFPLLLF